MIEQQPVFEAIDKMVERVNRFKIDPQFTQQVEERHGKVPDFTLDDQRILRHLYGFDCLQQQRKRREGYPSRGRQGLRVDFSKVFCREDGRTHSRKHSRRRLEASALERGPQWQTCHQSRE